MSRRAQIIRRLGEAALIVGLVIIMVPRLQYAIAGVPGQGMAFAGTVLFTLGVLVLVVQLEVETEHASIRRKLKERNHS